MRYQGLIFTRLFTRTVGRVAVGYLADPGCMDNANTTPRVSALVLLIDFLLNPFLFCAPVFSLLSRAAFSQSGRSIRAHE